MDPKCIFCRIITGDASASIVHQDDQIIAFLDIHPAAPIHILIVPLVHIPSINQISEENAQIIARMFKVAKQLAAKNGIDESGFRLIINSGPDANQTVFHLHLHLLGGRPMRYPMG
ncbi:MAG: histidine triad nucleotide-binding protein [Anaerolineales bacterium]|nr:histidine triad nucleotide-binding protein [Anaerolineales bacterium]